MDAEESAQEAALKSYRDQLAQVEMTLNFVETEEEKGPMRQLIDDLKELIQISEDALLQLKKSNLLNLIGGGESEVATGNLPTQSESITEDSYFITDETENLPNSSAPISVPSLDSDEALSRFKSLLGTLCRAPHPSLGGFHNAIVHSLDGLDEEGSLEVTVLYTHPQEASMITCPFFLEGRCKFDRNCRKNHGVVVKATDLRDYEEPDFESVDVGSVCLAKRDESGAVIWTPAEVLHLEEGLVTVQLSCVNKTVALPFADIFPLEEDESDDDLEPNAESIILAPLTKNDVEEEEVVREIRIVEDMSQFGDWEKNTRGIGTKLLSKWGYIRGSGLGKEGEGRVVPVEARIYPQGKSLDVCMAMRLKKETGASDPLVIRKRRRKKEKKRAEVVKKGYAEKNEESLSAFNLINSIKLNKKGGTVIVTDGETSAAKKPKPSERSGRDLRVQVLQTEGEIAKVEREMENVAQTIVRNEKKNSAVAEQAREKKKDLEKYKNKLMGSLRFIQGEQKNRTSKAKMSVF